MRKVNYKEKGITLIALVITIIILLILAGVTLTTALSQNGLFQRAKIAGENYKRAESDEAEKLDEYSSEIDKIINGEGTSSSEGKIKINEFSVNGTDVTDVPIPDGFVHVGGTINDGYVISDAHQDANKGADSDELIGNQFVWVPVKQNQKITLKVTSEEDITSIVVTDPYGKKILERNNEGKNYNNEEIEPTINGEYKVKVTTSTGETSKLLEVYSLYAQNFWITEKLILDSIFESMKAMVESQGGTIEELLDEMDMTKEELIEEYIVMTKNVESLDEFLAKIKAPTFFKETEDYKTNVNKYGGFYIGRYEAGVSSAETDRTESSSNTEQLVIQKNKYVYNYISYDDALNEAQKYATNVETNAKSSLLTGAAWDRTLGWLYETGDKTIGKLTVDSMSWGNYNVNTFFENTENPKKTGESEKTKSKNIYDLAGNVSEWTTEVNTSGSGWLTRGGMEGEDEIVSARANLRSYYDSSNRKTNMEVGFRVALYLSD